MQSAYTEAIALLILMPQRFWFRFNMKHVALELLTTTWHVLAVRPHGSNFTFISGSRMAVLLYPKPQGCQLLVLGSLEASSGNSLLNYFEQGPYLLETSVSQAIDHRNVFTLSFCVLTSISPELYLISPASLKHVCALFCLISL